MPYAFLSVHTQCFRNALLTLDDVGLNMVLRPDGDLLRDIKAVRGTARYMLLSGHLKGTGVPTRTRGKGTCDLGLFRGLGMHFALVRTRRGHGSATCCGQRVRHTQTVCLACTGTLLWRCGK